MRKNIHLSLVIALTAVMTVGPATALVRADCGCYSVEPVYFTDCGCDACESPRTGCGDAEIAATIVDQGCCGADTSLDAVPVEDESRDPQPVQTIPSPTEDPAPVEPSDPAPVEVPHAKAPQPAQQPVEPVQEAIEEPIDTPVDTPPIVESPITPPAEDPAVVDPAPFETEAEPIDNLFTPPATDTPPVEQEEAPAEQGEPAEESDPLDDLFSDADPPALLQKPGGLESAFNRAWTDNTSKYHCEARLLGLSQGVVVLAQASGKISHVSLRRLSDRDLNFVYQQVVAKREVLARQGEAERLAAAWSE